MFRFPPFSDGIRWACHMFAFPMLCTISGWPRKRLLACSASAHAPRYQTSCQCEAQLNNQIHQQCFRSIFFDGKRFYRPYQKHLTSTGWSVSLFKITALTKIRAYTSENVKVRYLIPAIRFPTDHQQFELPGQGPCLERLLRNRAREVPATSHPHVPSTY